MPILQHLSWIFQNTPTSSLSDGFRSSYGHIFLYPCFFLLTLYVPIIKRRSWGFKTLERFGSYSNLKNVISQNNFDWRLEKESQDIVLKKCHNLGCNHANYLSWDFFGNLRTIPFLIMHVRGKVSNQEGPENLKSTINDVLDWGKNVVKILFLKHSIYVWK